jgi:hypothetical protein
VALSDSTESTLSIATTFSNRSMGMLECIYNLVLLTGYARKYFTRSNELEEVK